MLLVEKTHEPSRPAVGIFARDLARALGSRPIQETEARRLVLEIDRVFKSAGTSTAGFLEHVANFENALVATGTERSAAHKLAAQLESIGRQVRGPEDTPVQPMRARFR